MKLATPRWRTPLITLAVLLLIGVLAPAVSAAPGAATANVTPGSVLSPAPAGSTDSYTYTLAPTNGQIGSFNLTAPTGWTITTVDSAPSGVQLVSGSIQGRGLTVTSSSQLTVTFTAQAPCVIGASTTWQTVAKTGGSFTGASVNVNGVTAYLDGTCSSVFVSPPTDAAFNANTNGPSENITSIRFTPSGTAIQAIVHDADGDPRPNTSVTLQLTAGPAGATLGGGDSKTDVTDAFGLATFPSSTNPITLDVIGPGYKMTPTINGTTIGTQQTTAFGIYQEGKPCSADNSCEVRGQAGGVSASISATPTNAAFLGGFVVARNLVDCDGYTEITDESIVWIYTGTGTQTITVLLSKQVISGIVDRGSAHLDVCYLAEPHPVSGDVKTFTDKFGVSTSGPALLPDCSSTITTNCIVSQVATPGGGRRVTFIVEDGRGRF